MISNVDRGLDCLQHEEWALRRYHEISLPAHDSSLSAGNRELILGNASLAVSNGGYSYGGEKSRNGRSGLNPGWQVKVAAILVIVIGAAGSWIAAGSKHFALGVTLMIGSALGFIACAWASIYGI